MTGALRTSTSLAAVILALAGAGCTNTVPAEEFIAKYEGNIAVPNINCSNLPMRSFMGRHDDGHFYLKDQICFRQGGGVLGKSVYYRCPAQKLPKGFPQAFRPGDVVFDGRPGSKHRYMLQTYLKSARPVQPPRKSPKSAKVAPPEPEE